MDKTTVGTITLEVTRRCNRRCAFCYQPAQRVDELPAEVLGEKVGALAREVGCSHVQLSGGEPLLRADLLSIIDALREAGTRVSMISDGGLLTAQLAQQLAERSLLRLQPTLLAGSPEVHDALRGAGAFADVTRAIAIASKAGIPVTVSLVLTNQNWDQAARVAELAFALGSDALTLCRFCPTAGQVELMPTVEQVRHAGEAAARVCRDLDMPLSAAITIPPCVWTDPARPPMAVGVCALVGPKVPVTVGPDGSIRSCALSTETVGTLDDPWPVLSERLWRRHLEPARAVPEVCQGCAQVARCGGGCRLSGLATHGCFEGVDPLANPVASR